MLITIIIASYNSSKTIRKALQSVKDQTFQDWECLVVDGASIDNTIEIVQEFADKDPRFRFFSEPDNGIYDAFNKGWKNAKGKWIYYLGSDDWLYPNGLKEIIDAEDDISAILSGDVIYTRLDGSSKRLPSGNPKLGSHQAMLTRRSIIERFGGFNEKYKIHADHELVIRILNAGLSMKLVHVLVGHFTVGGTSQRLSTILISTKEKYTIYKTFKSLRYPRLTVLINSSRKMFSLVSRSFIKYLSCKLK